MDDLTGFVSYDALVREPLRTRGWDLVDVSWRSTDAAWQSFDVVVIRTTWDYQDHPAEFMRALERISARTRVHNPLDVVRWNLRKTYLRELEECGVRCVPTLWADSADAGRIADAFDRLGTDEIVIKPQVGANADDALRIRRHDGTMQFAADTFRAKASMMQPFVPAVIAEGEFSAIFFGGVYSHTVLKTPKRDDFRVQEEHGGVITAVHADAAMIEAASAAVAEAADCCGNSALLYARADLVRMQDGGFALMELELIEPSLYLAFDDAAPDRFATAISRSA